jgi:protoporphyrinogen oxidase
MKDIVIVGAGLCGLSAAVSLAEDGIKPVILEKGDRPGGLARSIRLEGQYFESGVHTFYRPSHPLIKHLLDMSVRNPYSRKLNSALHIGGSRISPIAELKNFLSYPSGLKKDLLARFRRRPSEFDTLEQRLKSMYGPWLYESFFEAYIRKKLPGFSGNTVHGDWWGLGDIRDEFNEFDKGDHLSERSFTARIRDNISWWSGFLFGRDNIVIYPTGGIGAIAEGLETFINKKGIEIQYNVSANTINTKDGRLSGIELSNGDDIECEKLIWTGMLPDLTYLTDLEWPGDLPFVSTALVLVVFERLKSNRRKYLFEYCADKTTIFHRFYYTDFYSIDSDRFGVCVEISYGDGNDLPTDDEMTERTLEGLTRLGAIKNERVVCSKIIREERSHPVFTLNYRSVLRDLFSRIYSVAGIYPVGRSGAFNNAGMPATMLTGWNIGRHCAKGLS